MTRERAIEILKELWLLESEHIDSFEDEENKAFDMAISALSDYDKMQEISLDLAFENDELINKSRWIPVSERLPKAFETVLRTRVENGWNGTTYTIVDTGCICPADHNIVAWMPLPEPYNAESEVSE